MIKQNVHAINDIKTFRTFFSLSPSKRISFAHNKCNIAHLYLVLYSVDSTTVSLFFSLSETVKMLIALAILFTYPLQLTASLEVVWEAIKDKFSEKRQDFAYYLVRTLLIVGTGLWFPRLKILY